MDDTTIAATISSIYAAAVSYELWPEALDRLADLFDCSCVSLIGRNLPSMEARVAAVGVDAAGQRDFVEHWGQRNVFIQRTRQWRLGEIETDRQILPKADLLASDYYNDFLKPHDMHSIMRVMLRVEPAFRQSVTLNRSPSIGEFEPADSERFRQFVPHLLRASAISNELQRTRILLESLAAVLEQSATGILLLEANGRIGFANRTARLMAERTPEFALQRDRVEIVDAKEDGRFQRLVAGAVGRDSHLGAGRGGVMRVGRAAGAPLTIAVGPLPERSGYVESGQAVFVLITDPDAVSVETRPMLRELFGLSGAEIRMAERLLRGDSTEQAAIALNIKISTARWHLAALYRKTGTSRQAELLRLLLSLPSP